MSTGTIEKIKVCVYALCCIPLTGVYAQQKDPFWQRVRAANHYEEVKYQYTIFIYDANRKLHIDSTSGMLYYTKSGYLDSNSIELQGRYGEHYIKINPQEKRVDLGNIVAYARKHGIKLEDGKAKIAESIPENLLSSGEGMTIDSSDRQMYTIRVRPLSGSPSVVELKCRKSDLQIESIYLEYDVRSGDYRDFHHVYKYRFYNIRQSFDKSIFNFSRYFSYSGGQYRLNDRYKNYTVNYLGQP